ncbi:MAG: hypothetical protein HZC54_21210 [Verrucomicrobia bacterium]|nr:hypothetical protein [Verrucomicrobiota bacterium]
MLLAIVSLGNSVFAAWKECPSVEEEFKSSASVFVGKVVSAKNIWEPGDFIAGTFYKIQVEELLKGSPSNIIEVYCENSSGRFPMDVGVAYLVFAYSGVFEGVNGSRLAIDCCGNSGTLKEAGKALAIARKLRQTKAQSGQHRR